MFILLLLYFDVQVTVHRADSLRAGSGRIRPDRSRKLYDIYYCCVYSEKLLMMDRGSVRNM